MVVKDILKYKQKGDRTEHWVKERNKPVVVPNPWLSLTTTTTPMWNGVFGASSGTATQIQALQAQHQCFTIQTILNRKRDVWQQPM